MIVMTDIFESIMYSSYIIRCIGADDDGVPSKMDICGNVETGTGSGNQTLARGYVTSPNYPHRYSPDTNCRCVLKANADHTEILLCFAHLCTCSAFYLPERRQCNHHTICTIMFLVSPGRPNLRLNNHAPLHLYHLL